MDGLWESRRTAAYMPPLNVVFVASSSSTLCVLTCPLVYTYILFIYKYTTGRLTILKLYNVIIYLNEFILGRALFILCIDMWLLQRFVTGPDCNQCQRETFYLHERNYYGCIRCFCMGITADCTSSDLYRSQVGGVLI